IVDTTPFIVWDMRNYQRVYSLDTGDTYSVAWSPDNSQIAIGGLSGLEIIPANEDLTRTEINPYRLIWDLQIGSVAWNSSGSQLAAAANDGKVYILDTTTHEQLAVFEAYTEWAYAIAWSPDDGMIAVYGIDGAVTIWDANTGENLAQYLGNGGGTVAFSIGFSPYGGRFAYGLSYAGDVNTDLQSDSSARNLDEGAIQIVVPVPSLERLQAIQAACMTAPVAATMDTQALTLDALPEYMAQVESLTDAQIPPGCAADLVAVAEALMAQDQ
ncbi:MAG: hypothetical protein H7Y09_11710, partial [Chitinophagaceae bacterium]|nr:hypothetical protein [Anaerolineae bacterium]